MIIQKRLKAKSPDFFIQIQKWAVFFSVAIPAVATSLTQAFPDSPNKQKAILVLGALGSLSSVIVTIIAKLPVENIEDIK